MTTCAMKRPGFVVIVDGAVQLGDSARVAPSAYGTGVLAARDIAAGEIVLVEEAPLVASQKSTREPLHMQLAKRVLQDDERDALLEQMAVIYPRSLDEVDPEVLARARTEYARSVQKLLQEQQEGAKEGVRLLSESEMLGLVLKIAFSSFMGGIFVAGRKVRRLHAGGHTANQPTDDWARDSAHLPRFEFDHTSPA